jgi:hypothetical protein
MPFFPRNHQMLVPRGWNLLAPLLARGQDNWREIQELVPVERTRETRAHETRYHHQKPEQTSTQADYPSSESPASRTAISHEIEAESC